MFQQSWTLFTPPPDCNYRLFADYTVNGKAQRTEVLSDVLNCHKNRLGGNEPLVLAIANSIHYFEKASPLQAGLNGPIKNDKSFDVLEFSTRQYLKQQIDSNLQNLRLILEVRPVDGKQRRIYYN